MVGMLAEAKSQTGGVEDFLRVWASSSTAAK